MTEEAPFVPYSERFWLWCPKCGSRNSRYVNFYDYDSKGDDGIFFSLDLQCHDCGNYFDLQVNSGQDRTFVQVRYLPKKALGLEE